MDYQECSRCILSNKDYPEITFDKNGVCSICRIYDDIASKTIFRGDKGTNKLKQLITDIEHKGKNKPYNCIIALSGGVDSSYLAYMAKEWGLHPLVVHIDNGWNSGIAANNIKTLLNKLNLDLFTYVANWKEMKDIQLAHLKASILDIEGPFDNMFTAALYKIAKQHKIKYILMGYNTETEGWLPPNFVHYKLDKINLKAIQKKFGTTKLKELPLIGPAEAWKYEHINGIKMISPLNYIPYNKNEVKTFLMNNLGWQDHGYKHYENIFTRFYQGYILPQKFKIDKRKAHYSTLICSGQITREEAIAELKNPPYPNQEVLQRDLDFVLKKLEISQEEFETYMKLPIKAHTDYPSVVNIINRLVRLKRVFIQKNKETK